MLTPAYTKNLTDPGDKVLAHDVGTGRNEERTVTATMSHDDNDLWDLTIVDGKGHHGTLRTTAHHKVWSVGMGAWVIAADLHGGDQLREPGGHVATLAKSTKRPGHQLMLDLAVEIDHTFYVDFGGAAVLVHNSGCTSISDLPEVAQRNLTTNEDFAFQRLSNNHGITRIEFGNQIHEIKAAHGLPADFNLSFGPTGDVWDPISGELLGHIVHRG